MGSSARWIALLMVGAVLPLGLAGSSWLRTAPSGGLTDEGGGEADSPTAIGNLPTSAPDPSAAVGASRLELTESLRLNAEDPEPFATFARTVAISGDTMVLGAPSDDQSGIDAGAAYVFVRSGSDWRQQAKLLANVTAAHDGFGMSVAVHGDTVVVGARGHDDGGEDAGAAYVFRRRDGRWEQSATLRPRQIRSEDRFGQSVAVGDGVCAVGALGHDGEAEDSGAVYVFRLGPEGWMEEARLTPDEPLASELFGYATALDEGVIAVGAYANGTPTPYSGAAYVFRHDGQSWRSEGRLEVVDPRPMDETGCSVAVSRDRVVVGSRGNGEAGPRAGAAYVFERGPDGWVQAAKLLAADILPADALGEAVAIRGDLVVAGAHFRDDAGLGSGAAYVFGRGPSGWTQIAKLVASDATEGCEFGITVAIGDLEIVVGEPGGREQNNRVGRHTDCGAVYLYDLRGVPAL